MPKGKRRERGGRSAGGGSGRRAAEASPLSPSDDDFDCNETMSVVSNCSDMQTAQLTDGSEDQEVDETTAQDNFEDKLKSCIEGTSQKSAKGRVESLVALRAALSKQYIYDFVSERKMTLGDSIERCLKKGKGDEQSAAAMCSILLLMQLGTGDDGEEALRSLYPVLKVIMLDNSAPYAARAACAEALGLCTFIAVEEIELIVDTMNALESVFRSLYCKGDGSVPAHVPAAVCMHTSTLSAWTLLLSTVPTSVLQLFLENQLKKLSDLLLNADVDIRISAGEAIALLYELAKADDEDFEGDGFDDLCMELKKLSTECNKYRAKKDRRQQRSSFRDILNSVESGEFTKQRIRVNERESIIIGSWAARVQYDAFCHALGTGMSIHLQENDLLRDVFSLGPPLLGTNAVSNKVSKTERHMAHDAAFKARTKSRAKMRDKKSVGAGLD